MSGRASLSKSDAIVDQAAEKLVPGQRARPQRLKPPTIRAYGVAEATPLQNKIKREFFREL